MNQPIEVGQIVTVYKNPLEVPDEIEGTGIIRTAEWYGDIYQGCKVYRCTVALEGVVLIRMVLSDQTPPPAPKPKEYEGLTWDEIRILYDSGNSIYDTKPQPKGDSTDG